MKHVDKLRMMLVAGCMLAATSCSDFSDFNTVPTATEPGAEKTLWQNISENKDLSDFASVLQRLGYDKILDAPQAYTVWAPVNGSFDMEALSLAGDEAVEKEFLKNHIANYAHRETDVNDTVVYMLNEKLLKFSNKNSGYLSFDAQQLLPNASTPSVFNYPCVNGLLYVMSHPTTFRYNGYEYFAETSGTADSLFAYIKKYESIILDEENSVKGDIRDGVQHYDDSVVIVSNSLVEKMLHAELDNEDSLYTVLIPTNEAWVKAYDKISSYYKYIPSIAYQDLQHKDVGSTKGTNKTIMDAKLGSTTVMLPTPPLGADISVTETYWTDSITRRFIVNDLIFSETNQKYNGKLASGQAFEETDTLISTTFDYLTNLPMLDQVTEKVVQLSNGHARIINEYPFLQGETFAPIINSMRVGRVVTASGSGYSNERIDKVNLDPAVCVLKENQTALEYVKAGLPSASMTAPELDFYLPDVLSTTYTVYAVLVPACVEDMELPEEERKPYTLYFDLNYTDANNNQITGRFDGDTLIVGTNNVKTIKPFEVGASKVDTLKLGRITFPICYALTEAMPNVKVMNSVNSFTPANKKTYEQNLRVACIRLVPDGTKED